MDVEFSHNPKSDEIEPCITVAMLEQGGVDLGKLPSPLEPGASCMRLQEVIPDASAAYDMASLRLNVSVPQIYMTSLRRGYIDPPCGRPAPTLPFSTTASMHAAASRSTATPGAISAPASVQGSTWVNGACATIRT
jgi:outer membrane usher protein